MGVCYECLMVINGVMTPVSEGMVIQRHLLAPEESIPSGEKVNADPHGEKNTSQEKGPSMENKTQGASS